MFGKPKIHRLPEITEFDKYVRTRYKIEVNNDVKSIKTRRSSKNHGN